MQNHARRLVSLSVVTVLFVASYEAYCQNLSPSPGFQNWTNDQPDDWIIFGVGPQGTCDSCTVSRDTNIFRSGTSSLRTDSVPGPNDWGFPGVVAPVASLDAGDYDADQDLHFDQ